MTGTLFGSRSLGGVPTLIPRRNRVISQVYPGGTGGDFISVRHHSSVHHPDYVMAGSDSEQILNTRARGYVALCDGHAEWVARECVQATVLRHWDPSH